MSKIAVAKGDDRKENILKVLRKMEKYIDESIAGKGEKILFIKVNGLDASIPLSSTSPDALEAVVHFFHDKFDRIIVGDNTNTFKRKVHQYSNIKDVYRKVEFSDLTNLDSKPFIFSTFKGDAKVMLSEAPKEAYTISLSLPKTHDAVAFTGCSKNMLGCVVTKRWMVHGTSPYKRLTSTGAAKSNRYTHNNLARLIGACRPDLAIMDAFVGMEGNGPVLGTPISLGIAMCSLDSIALDLFASKLFGFDHVWYLERCADEGYGSREAMIMNIGFRDIDEIRRIFKKHKNYKYMLMDTSLEKGVPKIDASFLWFMVSRPKRLAKKAFELLKG